MYLHVIEYLKANNFNQDDNKDSFSLQDDGTGPYIKSWDVVGLDEPTVQDLAALQGNVDATEAAEALYIEEQERKRLMRGELLLLAVTTVSGKEFNADEISQNRIGRVICSLADGQTTPWKLLDNTWTDISKEELRESLILATQAETIIMQKY